METQELRVITVIQVVLALPQAAEQLLPSQLKSPVVAVREVEEALVAEEDLQLLLPQHPQEMDIAETPYLHIQPFNVKEMHHAQHPKQLLPAT